MRPKLLLPCLAGSAVIALSAVLGLSPAQQEPARPNAAEPPSAKGDKPQPAKRVAPVPMQAELRYAQTSTNEFKNPEESAYKDFHQLRLTTETFLSPHAKEVQAPDKFELLCYNGRPVGPTIRVRRGTTFHIHVKNDLKSTSPNPPVVPDPVPPNARAEQPHDLCTTNLHTHGLHVSPASNADNVFQEIEPGHEFTFEYTIRADHPSGTFWYHPHRHGSVAYQSSNGLAGALIVEGSPDDGVPDLEKIPEIAAAKERILVFQLYNFRTGDDGVGRIDANKIYNVTPKFFTCPAIALSGADPGEAVTPQATAINGVINPVMRITPGEVQRWRLIHAAWDVDRQLTLVDDQGAAAKDLVFHEIALDGLATGTMVAKSNTESDDGSNVEIAPGQRSDVLIQAPLLKPGESERTYYLKQSGLSAAVAPHNRAQDPLFLAKIIVGGRPHDPMKLPDPRALVECRPFLPIRDEELSKTSSFPNGIAFRANDDNDLTKPHADRRPYYTINDAVFDPNKTVQIRLNTAEEWTLTAKESSHPFHIHVNPFQVVMRKDANGKSTPMNVWRDTLYIPQGETYTIRSRFRDFLGRTVFHCHILDHEDQGMMAAVEFIPPYQTPGAVNAGPGANLKPDAAPAPSLKLPEAGGGERGLAEFRGRNVVLVFFQGVECIHCAGKLRDLVREARGAIGPDAQIVAVSSMPVDDPARALRTLGVSPTDKFHLLVDEGLRAFRDFGCYDDGPLHGLFLIDRDGVIRARYTGESPFGDTREAVRQARALAAPADRPALP